MNAERNDVDLKPLFSWGRLFEIVDGNNAVTETLYMRIVGDADLNRARTFAYRKSAEKRKELRDKNSDEYVAYIPDIEVLERERLVPLCTLFASKEISRKAVQEVRIRPPKEPRSGATLEEQEEYQKAVDDYPEKQDAAYREYISAKIEKLTVEFERLSDIDLYNTYIRYLTDELCEVAMLRAFKAMCTYLGTYKDSSYKTKYFTSYAEFENLDEMIKSQFVQAYESLEVNPEELKKLRVATR